MKSLFKLKTDLSSNLIPDFNVIFKLTLSFATDTSVLYINNTTTASSIDNLNLNPEEKKIVKVSQNTFKGVSFLKKKKSRFTVVEYFIRQAILVINKTGGN